MRVTCALPSQPTEIRMNLSTDSGNFPSVRGSRMYSHLSPSCASHLPAALCKGVGNVTSSLHCLYALCLLASLTDFHIFVKPFIVTIMMLCNSSAFRLPGCSDALAANCAASAQLQAELLRCYNSIFRGRSLLFSILYFA